MYQMLQTCSLHFLHTAPRQDSASPTCSQARLCVSYILKVCQFSIFFKHKSSKSLADSTGGGRARGLC